MTRQSVIVVKSTSAGSDYNKRLYYEADDFLDAVTHAVCCRNERKFDTDIVVLRDVLFPLTVSERYLICLLCFVKEVNISSD